MIYVFLVIIFLGFIRAVNGQTCNTGQETGPCLDGVCPSGGTCLAATQNCCPDGQVVPTTPASLVATTVSTACVDKLNPLTGVSDCPSRSFLCNNAVYFTIMSEQCPATCGRCSNIANPTGACLDRLNPSTGVSDCPSRAYLCNNAVYFTLMTQQCPATCGRCSVAVSAGAAGSVAVPLAASSSCTDQVNPRTGVSDCPSKAFLCNNPVYLSLMTRICPNTCGRCSG